MPSATITSQYSGETVGSAFTVSGTSPGCTNVTVVVTHAGGETTHSTGVLFGNFSVDFSGIPDGPITISAYCTAQGPATADNVPCLASASIASAASTAS